MTPLHGWIILDKPVGPTSAQAVAAVKRIAREGGHGKLKVGHGGTLDPLASGVLPIALGEATKLTGAILNGNKNYAFTIRFGAATSTDDAEGEVIATSGARPTLAELEAVLPRFKGTIRQRPPAYSALKVSGKRAYARARAGEAVEMPEREVVVKELGISSPCRGEDGGAWSRSDLAQPGEGPPPLPSLSPASEQARKSPYSLPVRERIDEVTLAATVSKGTYIRSLAREIARALGTVGHVSMLRRTRCGPFTLETAISLDNLQSAAMQRDFEAALLPLTAGLDDIPALPVTPGEADLLRHGQPLTGRPEPDGTWIAMDGNTPVALVSLLSGEVRVRRGFNL